MGGLSGKFAGESKLYLLPREHSKAVGCGNGRGARSLYNWRVPGKNDIALELVPWA